MPRGGYRPNAGRKPGRQNRETVAMTRLRAMKAEAAENLSLLDFLKGVAFDPEVELTLRIKAASVCLPFLFPRLQSVDVNVTKEVWSHESFLNYFADAIDITPDAAPTSSPQDPAPSIQLSAPPHDEVIDHTIVPDTQTFLAMCADVDEL